MTLDSHLPTWPHYLALCGWSGSGKTWLLERLIQRLSEKGYWIGAIKHDAHQLNLDRPGKNTARLWEAGAKVLLAHDPQQGFIRYRKSGEETLAGQIQAIACQVDFILVEGHKGTGLPKIWLEHSEKENPNDLTNVLETLAWRDESRLVRCEQIVLDWLNHRWRSHSINAGILLGGQSTRMGTPKHKLQWQGSTLLNHLYQIAKPNVHQTLLLGNPQKSNSPIREGKAPAEPVVKKGKAPTEPVVGEGEVPTEPVVKKGKAPAEPVLDNTHFRTLPDIPDGQGPLAGMLSAMRWNPYCAWLFLACDMPLINHEAIEWLLNQREPGTWCIMPHSGGQTHPLGALYEPQMSSIFERNASVGKFSLQAALDHPKVKQVEIPPELQKAWTNCNTPEEWKHLNESQP